MTSPLEQFEILVLSPLKIAGVDFSLTNSGLYSFLILFFLFMFFYISISKSYLVPGRWQVVAESFYTFLEDMVRGQAGKKAFAYFPLFTSAFFVILAANLLGIDTLWFYCNRSYNNYIQFSVGI